MYHDPSHSVLGADFLGNISPGLLRNTTDARVLTQSQRPAQVGHAMQPGSPTTMLDSANPFPQDSIGIKELLIAGRIFFAASLRSFQHVGGTTEVFTQDKTFSCKGTERKLSNSHIVSLVHLHDLEGFVQQG